MPSNTTARPSVRVNIRLTQPWFEIRRSGIQGRGAFAVRTIPKGTRIIEYTGERISHAEADKRYDDEAMGRHHTFLFIATSRTVVDARREGSEAKYINHACDPNCEAVIDRGRIFIEAVKTIRAGQELVYDYSYGRDGTETAADERRYRCRCGRRKCRGSILEPKPEASAKGHRSLRTRR
ncbi:MAG: SET domain-containing protein [Gemmatimonadota bacterium]|jgi:SET domain-containing protein|nr:SET domain-containing protein-lysine N-methyltransferase [Gemmatimonadota bacterium]